MTSNINKRLQFDTLVELSGYCSTVLSLRKKEEVSIQQSPLIHRGYVPRPQWMPETSDHTIPYIHYVFSIYTYL